MSEPFDIKDEFITAKEAARLFKVSVQTIKNYIYGKKIQSFKTPGGHHRIRKQDLLRHLGYVEPKKEEEMKVHRCYEDLHETYFLIIKSLLRALDKRDTYEGSHSERVATYCVKILRELGLSERDRKMIQLGALLHDIGKIGVREEILRKSRKLTKEDVSAIRLHPEIGEDMIDFSEDIKKIIRHHHERYDGLGYPDGLGSDQIPIGARIVSIAETYDALTSNSPFRKALPFKKATLELKKVAGTQLDCELVEVFLKVIKKENQNNPMCNISSFDLSFPSPN